MSGILSGDLPAGWRRPDIAWRDPATVEVVREVVAGPEVDIGAELLSATVSATTPDLAALADTIDRAQRSLDAVAMPCVETMLAIDALETAEALARDMQGAVATPTRAERIEAAARAFVLAEGACANLRFRGGTAMPDVERLLATNRAAVEARDALRAALCSCNAHGPDPACVDHGAAIRARMAGWSP